MDAYQPKWANAAMDSAPREGERRVFGIGIWKSVMAGCRRHRFASNAGWLDLL